MLKASLNSFGLRGQKNAVCKARLGLPLNILKAMLSSHPKWKLEQFGQGENTLRKYLVEYQVELMDGSHHFPRQVRKAHFTSVLPEKVPKPYLIGASRSCADMLNLDSNELTSAEFAAVFSGNKLLPSLGTPYATVYGCHSYGQWFGQLGDGRALSIGEVYTAQKNNIEDIYTSHRTDNSSTGAKHDTSATTKHSTAESSTTGTGAGATAISRAVDHYGDHVIELQLKGCGRSPYSRGFDGKAVLRSSIREFLVSEAMHHLGVPTTRALSVVGTGETIHRAWYDNRIPIDTSAPCGLGSGATPAKCPEGLGTGAAAATATGIGTGTGTGTGTGQCRVRKYAPNMMRAEPGAVLCRVSRSFLRFGQLELFGQRGEMEHLRQLADFVCFREYPDLLELVGPQESATGALSKAATAEALAHAPPLVQGGSQTPAAQIAAGEGQAPSPPPPGGNTGSAGTPATASPTQDSRPPLPATLPTGSVERYIALYRRATQRTARLVAHWLRVGYVQGNMNSDNTLLSGATIDYGPYGWMERFDPLYQPFTSDQAGNFAFVRQPLAMCLNVAVLGETAIAPLVQHVYMTEMRDRDEDTHDTPGGHLSSGSADSGAAPATSDAAVTASAPTEVRDLDSYLSEVKQIAEVEFAQFFTEEYNEVKRRKLGLHTFQTAPAVSKEAKTGVTGRDSGSDKITGAEDSDAEPAVGRDEQLWRDLERLMATSDVDFTILFRELGAAAETLTSTCATTAPATKTTSVKAAREFVPVGIEVSLFPNIDYAVSQSASEGEGDSEDRLVSREEEPKSDSRGSMEGVESETSEESAALARRAFDQLQVAFYDPAKIQPSNAAAKADPIPQHATLGDEWLIWLERYGKRLREDARAGRLTSRQRREMQDRANPKYVLRNWMAALAYERAEQGDYSVIEELTALLEDPYSNTPYRPAPSAASASASAAAAAAAATAEPTGATAKAGDRAEKVTESEERLDPAIREAGSSCGAGAEDKWYRKTPEWARTMPGVAFMSCSS